MGEEEDGEDNGEVDFPLDVIIGKAVETVAPLPEVVDKPSEPEPASYRSERKRKRRKKMKRDAIPGGASSSRLEKTDSSMKEAISREAGGDGGGEEGILYAAHADCPPREGDEDVEGDYCLSC
ncbi:hypothetical protein KSP39_PZI001062 [Platanthera zijinensis]|uniref:Uncharacterized protein n=1 Tax=Platanthera zijinensis TaxID=2320716 RepID=A0AAP0GG95_9ASPA